MASVVSTAGFILGSATTGHGPSVSTQEPRPSADAESPFSPSSLSTAWGWLHGFMRPRGLINDSWTGVSLRSLITSVSPSWNILMESFIKWKTHWIKEDINHALPSPSWTTFWRSQYVWGLNRWPLETESLGWKLITITYQLCDCGQVVYSLCLISICKRRIIM